MAIQSDLLLSLAIEEGNASLSFSMLVVDAEQGFGSLLVGDISEEITDELLSELQLSICVEYAAVVSEVVDIGDEGDGGSEKAGEYTCPWYR